MKNVYNALIVFFYAIYCKGYTAHFEGVVKNNLDKSIPLTSKKLIIMSEKIYKRNVKFLNMAEKFELEIEKKAHI